MISRRILFIVACGLAVCAAGPALGQIVTLDNGLSSNTDGALSIGVDAYGSWSSSGFGGGGDAYNPIGGGPQLSSRGVVFSNGFFLFRGGDQRELLSESPNFQNSVSGDDDMSLTREIVSPNVLNGDTASSRFRVFGDGIDVTFDLTQSLTAPATEDHVMVVATAYGDGNNSTLYQTYTPINNLMTDVSFSMVRAVDADVLFGPGQAFNDDEVGTETHANDPPGTLSAYQEDTPNPGVSRITTTISSSPDAPTQVDTYYGGLQGDQPGGVEPTMGYGTDVQVWDAYGVPTNWRNYIGNVGYDVDGQSGAQMGSDTFHGIGVNVVNLPGVPEPTSFALMSLLGMGLLAFRRRIA